MKTYTTNAHSFDARTRKAESEVDTRFNIGKTEETVSRIEDSRKGEGSFCFLEGEDDEDKEEVEVMEGGILVGLKRLIWTKGTRVRFNKLVLVGIHQ